MAIRHSREREKWSEHTRELKPLDVGDHVYVQNVVGNNPRKWERTGIVVEALPFRQYNIKLDGSGRITLRNRRHLRKFTPFYSNPLKKIQPAHIPAAHTVQKSERPEYHEPITNSSLGEAPHFETQVESPHSSPILTEKTQPAAINIEAVEPTTAINSEVVEPVAQAPQAVQPKPKEKKIPLALRRLLD